MTSLIVAEGPGAVNAETERSPHILEHIDAAIIEARSECLGFSKLMNNKLPKELRDLVYGHLCHEDRRIPIGPYYHFRKYEPFVGKGTEYSDTQYCPRDGDLQTELADNKIRVDHDIYPEEDLILPKSHLFDPNYMGEDVAVELLEVYWESNRFSACNVEGGLDELCKAVPVNTASSELVPLDHVRDLQLRMKFEHLTPCVGKFEQYTGFQIGHIAELESNLRAAVNTLRMFRTRIVTIPHELKIEIVLMTDLHKLRLSQELGGDARAYFINFLQTIRNMVYELLYDCEYIVVRVTHQDDGLMAFPKDYTGLFNLTKEQWAYEKSRQSPNCDWAENFWILPVNCDLLPVHDQAKLGGYNIDQLDEFVRSRWGVGDIFRETVSIEPIVEGPYWPVGRPVDALFARERQNTPTLIYDEQCN
ncbi:hypothetical protein E8E12_008433 [Didymella heteroderae]|uniref:Uncharacterized protein n=1 Tax=Didymella heteroderae TaxID=1769908 RepID=A0A9P4WT72_9PLEO|nr:hypothetical protein E8E12_008433 [Didymella heteroderae]